MRWVVLLVVFVTACVESDLVRCSDDQICPPGTQCAAVTDPDDQLCVSQEELDACSGKERYAQCATSRITTGRCYDGVCLAIGCGNGRIDRADPNAAVAETGENCDDGNQKPGDGCSADCLSDETCGNGTIDLAKREACDDGNHVDHDRCNSTCQDETVRWSRRTIGDPPLLALRSGAAIAYDIARNQLVLFGGTAEDPNTLERFTYGDTWIWDGKGWIEAGALTAPVPRSGHQMAYDAARHRIVLFGGVASDGLSLADTWEWDGADWRRASSIASPTARAGHMMTYDAKRKRVVLFGGSQELAGALPSFVEFPETWLWDGVGWTQQDDPTVMPHPSCVQNPKNGRANGQMAFDPSRGVTVLFGGMCTTVTSGGGGNFFVAYHSADDVVWELDASGWHSVATTSTKPATIQNGAMTYVPSSHRVMLFGSSNEHWEWNGSVWLKVLPGTLPDTRNFQAMTTDPERGHVVLASGTTDAALPAMWEFDGSDWHAPDPTVLPGLGDPYAVPAPTAPVATFDRDRQRTVLVNGSNETYELAGTSWTKLASVGSTLQYTYRWIAYDDARKVTVLFISDATYLSTIVETWLWNGTAWSMATPASSPLPRFESAMTYDRERQQVVLFGGGDASTNDYLDETWTWNGSTWTLAAPAHKPPKRSSMVLGYDPLRRTTIMFGGFFYDGVSNNYTSFTDTWLWDGADWREATTTAKPPERFAEAITWQPTRGRLLMFGGYGRSDAWEWNGETESWELLGFEVEPPARGESLLVPESDGGGVLLFGGYQRSRGFNLPHPPLVDGWHLRWRGETVGDSCTDRLDLDGDTLVGCADPDCWTVCAPRCEPSPEQATCEMAAPKCGDSACDGPQETCRSCPEDCSACTPVCGDGYCEGTETATSCPGDC